MPWNNPASATSVASRLARLTRDGWDISIETRSILSFAGDDYRLEATLEARHNDALVFSRTWDERLPRPRAVIPGVADADSISPAPPPQQGVSE